MNNLTLLLCGAAAVVAFACWWEAVVVLHHMYKQSRMTRNSYEVAKAYLKYKYVFARWVAFALIGTTASFGGIVSIGKNGTIEGWPAIVVVSALGLLALSMEMYHRNCNRHDKLVVEHAKAMKSGQKNK